MSKLALATLLASSLALASGSAAAQEIMLTGPIGGGSSRLQDAEIFRTHAIGSAELWTGYARALTARGAAPSDIGGAGLAARLYYGNFIGVAVGFEFTLGALASPKDGGAFAGNATIFPIGLALIPTNDIVLAVSPGVAFDGATAGLPAALALPVEFRVAFDACDRLRVTADFRATNLPNEPRRQDGALDFSFTDEATARLALRWGHKWPDPKRRKNQGETSAGYFVRFELGERMERRYLGLAIGHEIVGGTYLRREPW